MNKEKLVKIIFVIIIVVVMITVAVVMFWPKEKVIPTKEEYEGYINVAGNKYTSGNSDVDMDVRIDGYAYVSLQKLVDLGYLDKKLIDPDTEKEIDLSQNMKITSNDSAYLYELTYDYQKPTSFVKYLYEIAGSNVYSMYYDGSGDNNLRYWGLKPNNYIYLSVDKKDTRFRIIGLFDVNGTKRIKVVSDDYLGNMSWNAADSNDWNSSSLKKYLNDKYAKKLSGISDSIDYNTGSSLGNQYTAFVYEDEKASKVSSVVSLISASDYGYASGKECSGDLNTKGYQYLGSYSDTCYSSNWLYKGQNEWLLTPVSGSKTNVMYISANGDVITNNSVTNKYQVRATFYLPDAISLKSGSGSYDEPYVIEFR